MNFHDTAHIVLLCFLIGRLDGARVGIISTWDVENNAVRILAATLRAGGHHVTEIYFKDWISNNLTPASDIELQNLVKVIRREQLNVVCISIRASAYSQQAKILAAAIHDALDIPVLFGAPTHKYRPWPD